MSGISHRITGIFLLDLTPTRIGIAALIGAAGAVLVEAAYRAVGPDTVTVRDSKRFPDRLLCLDPVRYMSVISRLVEPKTLWCVSRAFGSNL